MKQLIHEEKTQTTCVLRLFGAPLWTVQQAVQQTGLAAQCRSRGAETLAALQAETPAVLSKARKALADRFAAELYGEGEMTLVHAAVQALETHHRLLVCCDADAGTLLEARMETVAGAEKVFDFGAMSYADAKVREKLSAKVCRVKGGPVPAKLTRVRAAQRLVGADFAAGCLERAEDTVLFLGSRKGCWVRTVANADTPALWLLDMIRRAASGLPQAAGTIWQKYARAIPADALTAQRLPDKPEPDAPTAAPRKRHRVRNALIFLLILALAAFAAAWYYTGGDLAALPQQLQAYRDQHARQRVHLRRRLTLAHRAVPEQQRHALNGKARIADDQLVELAGELPVDLLRAVALGIRTHLEGLGIVKAGPVGGICLAVAAETHADRKPKFRLEDLRKHQEPLRLAAVDPKRKQPEKIKQLRTLRADTDASAVPAGKRRLRLGGCVRARLKPDRPARLFAGQLVLQKNAQPQLQNRQRRIVLCPPHDIYRLPALHILRLFEPHGHTFSLQGRQRNADQRYRQRRQPPFHINPIPLLVHPRAPLPVFLHSIILL